MALLPVSKIVQLLSPKLAETILVYTQSETRETFASAMLVLTSTLKFRPTVWKTWTKERQREWLLSNLRQARFAGTALQILQEWCFKQRAAMLNSFLDALGVAHDEDGYVSDALPDTFDADKVRGAVEGLLKEFAAEEVALYLHLFQGGRDGGWETISALLDTDARLRLGAATAA
jgi:hypothetical protein